MSTVLDLDQIVLESGGHKPPNKGEPPQMCFNEAVAYFNHQPWSAAPKCVSPVIRRFTMSLNDRWSDEDRQQLKPYIRQVVGTNTGEADDEIRRWMCADWLVHEYAPAAFRAVGATAEAEQFEQLAAITGPADWTSARETIYSVRDAMWERRKAARSRLRGAVAAAVAVADAVADAAAVAAAVADAAADAAAVAAADAVADAAADADAAAVAAADAVAAAAAVAAADADAGPFKAIYTAALEAAKNAGKDYWARRAAAYRVFKPYYDDRYREAFGDLGLRTSALGLLDRLIEVGKTKDEAAA